MKRLLFVILLLLVLVVPPASAAPVVAPDAPLANALRISQVYGGGGNTGATYKNDFIELFNSGSSAVSLAGWSVQYASSSGTTWAVTSLTGSIAAGGYYLIQEVAGTGGTTNLPTPDATGTIAMSATAGKVALVNGTTALSGSCPTGVIDFVGFGGANCYEGTGPTPAPSNTNAVSRADNGCTDTDNNSADFTAVAPNPRNSQGSSYSCTNGDWSPAVSSTTPAKGATNVAVNADIMVTFSEAVNVTTASFTISCASSGAHTFALTGSGAGPFTLNPDSDFTATETCTVTAVAAQITDTDTNDPPDNMTTDYVWTFTADIPPTVASTTPANGATGVAVDAAITVNFSESVDVGTGAFTVECPTGTAVTFTPNPALPATGTSSVVLTPGSNLPHNTVCTVTVLANKVTDKDGTPEDMAANHVFSFTTVAPPTSAKIHAIQGSGSAVVPGTYFVEAIVTGDYQGVTGTDDYKLDGFFIQEEDADVDSDPATSEGIFVYCGTCPTNVVVGDKVQVTGASSEFFGMSQLSATTAGAVVVVSSGNTLPTPAALTLPVPGVTATDLAGATAQINAYYEQFEGMLVQFPTALSVTEYFELSRYGQVVLAQDGRFRQLTDKALPSVAGYTAHQIDLAKRKVILDDDSNQQNHALFENVPVFHPTPGFSITNYVRGGDTITNLTGVLHWSFAGLTGTDAWRIRPVMNASNAPVYSYAFTSGNPRGAVAAVGGNLKVASFNVLNYFTTLGSRGANSTAELDRQAAKIIAAFAGLNADVIGVMEIENNNDVAIADLVSRLNASAGAGTYAYVATGTVGTDQITVGIIYKPAKVTPVGAVQTLTAAAFTDPNSTGTQRNRPAVAQTFEEKTWGERFTVVVNHLKSKGSCPSSGINTDQGDGQGCWNATRAAAAAYMVGTWIPTLAASSGDPDFLVVGDLNAYRKEAPITNIKSAGYADLLDTWLGAPAYGYVFDGQLGYLDHALSSATLTPQVSGASEWHINADEANLLDYNDTVKDTGEQDFDVKPSATTLYEANAYRSSDHDPVLVGLNLLPNQGSLTDYAVAWHTGESTVFLGNARERGAGTADNDGVVRTPGVNWQVGATGGSINVTVTGATGYFSAWIDWNGNNSFADAGEFVINNRELTAETHTLTFEIPAGVTFSNTFNARFRLYAASQTTLLAAGFGPDVAPSPTGGATGGEVEDYTWDFGPNAVGLRSLTAVPALPAAWPLWAGLVGLAGLAALRRRR